MNSFPYFDPSTCLFKRENSQGTDRVEQAPLHDTLKINQLDLLLLEQLKTLTEQIVDPLSPPAKQEDSLSKASFVKNPECPSKCN